MKNQKLSKEQQAQFEKLLLECGAVDQKFLPEHNICKDLGLDSLDFVELVMAIEEEFEIEISDRELPDKINTATVDTMQRIIAKKLCDQN